MRKILVAALAFSLSGGPAFAQMRQSASTPATPSLLDSARAEAVKLAAAAQPSSGPGGMSPAYFWTAIGLMGVGGIIVAQAALVKTVDSVICDDFDDEDFDIDCGGISTGMLIAGLSVAGAGGVVYLLGKRKAAAQGSPQIVPTPRGVAIRSRFSF